MTQFNYLSQEQVESILKSAQDEIRETIKSRAVAQVSTTVEWELKKSIETTVKEWFEENARNDVIAALATSREIIVNTALLSAESMAKGLAEAMSTHLAKKLADDWGRQKLLKELFS